METCIKITWDDGNEHLIQNKDNYFYSILDPYLEGCKRYNVYGNFRVKTYSIYGGCQEPLNWTEDGRRLLVNGTYAQNSNSPFAFNPIVEFVEILEEPNNQACNPRYKYGYKISQYTDNQCTNLQESTFITRGGNKAELISIDYEDVVNNNSTPPIKLKVIDGDIEYLYSLIDKNSVQVVEYECNQCPENTLDCEECCLPCDEVLDRICNIKNIFIGV